MKELVLAAVLSLAQEPVRADVARLEAIAEDVAAVAGARDAPVVFDGPAGREATALLLVAIAAHESGFAADIDRCERRGDRGSSRTMWQLIGPVHLKGRSKHEVCSDRRLAARLALEALADARARSPGATPQQILNEYASGDRGFESPQSRRTCSMWQTRAERLGLIGAYCHKKLPIAWREPACTDVPPEWKAAARRAMTGAAVPLPDALPPLSAIARLLPAVVLALPACADEPATTPVAATPAGGVASAGGPATASGGAPAAIATARRPTRKYYFGRTRERCEVYWVDGDRVSTPAPAPCPADLAVGERIRLAGMTCLREGSSDPAREHPVVCPDPLTNAEKRDRAAKR